MIRIRSTLPALLLAMLAVTCASAQSKNLAGIAHVAFRVSDLERSQKFFEALGFEKAFEFSESGKVSEIFIKVNDRQFIELYPRMQESQAIGFMHICFEATDIEALRKAYMSVGLNPPEAKKFRAGNLLFVLHDPEGQLLEYTQYLPGSLHDADRGQHLGSQRISTYLLAASTPATTITGRPAALPSLPAILPATRPPESLISGRMAAPSPATWPAMVTLTPPT